MTTSSDNNDNKPQVWDEDRAIDLLDSLVLIGITRNLEEGPLFEQAYGTIKSACRQSGFSIDLQGSRNGETLKLPPDTTAFRPAPPGEYRLKSTGEIVTNPDFLTTWIIEPKRH